MAVPKKKHSRGRKGGRTAHFGLKAKSFAACPRCNNARMPHRVCPSCGYYNGREVVPTVAEESA